MTKLVKQLCVIVMLLSISLSCFSMKIDMQGKWESMQKSINMDIPIEASIDESSKQLSLQFYEDLGLVYVKVTNFKGEIS